MSQFPSILKPQLQIVLLGHKSQVGKDTLASFMKDYTRVAFADRIKTLACEMFFLNYEQVTDPILKNKMLPKFEKTPREILIKLGNDMRAIDKDVWCNYIYRIEIPRLMKTGIDKFVITDFRFKNEYKCLMNELDRYSTFYDVDIKTIKIERPDHNIDFSGKNDQSEIDLDDFTEWSAIIQNDGTPEQLYEKALHYL